MFDLDVSCPHCEEKFKLNLIGLEGKEFIQCPHCRRVIKTKTELAGLERVAIWAGNDIKD